MEEEEGEIEEIKERENEYNKLQNDLVPSSRRKVVNRRSNQIKY